MNVSINCEILSPLFMGGSNPRVNPEIRPPSIRGSARYWLRALIAGSSLVQGDNVIDVVSCIETSVFGATDTAGAIALTIRSTAPALTETYQKDRAVRTLEGDFLPTGKDYLLWSMASSGREGTDRYLPAREYIKPGTAFQIILRARLEREQSNMLRAAAALWLMSNLGALGSRAYRGAGSIHVASVVPPNGPSFRTCSTPHELCAYLAKGLQDCLSTLGDRVTWRSIDSGNAQFDTLAPRSARIWVVAGIRKWTSYLEALNGIGEKLRDYRSHHNSLGRKDHDAVLDWLQTGGDGPEIKRAIFGLPIPFRYSDGGPSDVIQSDVSDRRSSPLHIKLARLADGSYVGVLTLFKSSFLDGARLRLQTRKKWTAPTPTDYSIIEDFVQTFDSRSRWEVSL